MGNCRVILSTLLVALIVAGVLLADTATAQERNSSATGALDQELAGVLAAAGFTGRVESTLEVRLGRRLDHQLAGLGNLLWFDTIVGLNNDNTCAGCHSPTSGFADSQSIAIGIDNNGVVGPHRSGPRNLRRSPTVINTAFYPTLMWNSRFRALSGNPFDNRQGFQFPLPEGMSLSGAPHLLAAQAFIPPTERTEAAGFSFPGDNDALRAEVLRRLNANDTYRKLFAKSFSAVKDGAPITFDQVGRAVAEFELSLTYANAPIDQFARGDRNALNEDQKRGALLFFGRAGCVACHAVAGMSNEMFSDFQEHVIGVPQVAPQVTNNVFDGPGSNEDFGLEQISGNPADRYKFRTTPLRNLAVQPTLMHNGAFTSLDAAIRHHLNVVVSVQGYSPVAQGLAPDLQGPVGPSAPVLERLDPRLVTPIVLTDGEFRQLLAFVREGLLDPRARPEQLRRLVPKSLPSGNAPLGFEFN